MAQQKFKARVLPSEEVDQLPVHFRKATDETQRGEIAAQFISNTFPSRWPSETWLFEVIQSWQFSKRGSQGHRNLKLVTMQMGKLFWDSPVRLALGARQRNKLTAAPSDEASLGIALGCFRWALPYCKYLRKLARKNSTVKKREAFQDWIAKGKRPEFLGKSEVAQLDVFVELLCLAIKPARRQELACQWFAARSAARTERMAAQVANVIEGPAINEILKFHRSHRDERLNVCMYARGLVSKYRSSLRLTPKERDLRDQASDPTKRQALFEELGLDPKWAVLEKKSLLPRG